MIQLFYIEVDLFRSLFKYSDLHNRIVLFLHTSLCLLTHFIAESWKHAMMFQNYSLASNSKRRYLQTGMVDSSVF